MTATTTTTFEIAELKRAIEERDAAGQLALYAENAEVRVVDRDNPPSSPRTLRGRDQIRTWIEDLCARDMTHRVERQVSTGDRAAFETLCSYPDGTRVLCLAMLDLGDGRIVQQTLVQAWDA